MIIHLLYGNEVCTLLVLITYDVNTSDVAGKKRLSKVAKICVNYGQRVQNSVFECLLDNAQLIAVKSKLLKIINQECDSLRIYNLGNSYTNRIEHFGVKAAYNPEDTIIM